MITPEPPAGSEHYREGWRHGYEQAAIDRERSADAVRLVPDTGQAREQILQRDITFGEYVIAVCDAIGLPHDSPRAAVVEAIRAAVAAAQAPESPTDSTPKAGRGGSGEAETATGTGRAPDVAATALRDAARLLDMVADARDVYLEGMEEDSEPAVAIETFGSGIRSAARVLRAEPHTVELLVPTWRYLGELAELDAQVRALLGTDTTPDRLAWISEAGETAAAERQARYQETACARRTAEERPDA